MKAPVIVTPFLHHYVSCTMLTDKGTGVLAYISAHRNVKHKRYAIKLDKTGKVCFNFKFIKPILRPISTLTKTEFIHLFPAYHINTINCKNDSIIIQSGIKACTESIRSFYRFISYYGDKHTLAFCFTFGFDLFHLHEQELCIYGVYDEYNQKVVDLYNVTDDEVLQRLIDEANAGNADARRKLEPTKRDR